MREAIQMKSQVVAEIVEKLQKSSSTIVVDYKGLTVEEVTELRKKMREAGVEYKVYKNTLVRRAAKEVGIEEFYNEAQIVEFANIPPREVLLAKLLGSLKAPMSNFVYLLDALVKKEEGQEA